MDINLLKDPFIISRYRLLNHDDLNIIYSLSDGYLYFKNKDSVFKYSYVNNRIYIIGYVLDIRDSNSSITSISHNLLSSYPNKEKFLETLEYLSGRYIIIIDNGEKSELYTDATGLKPLFYWYNLVFSSHEILIREIVNANFEEAISQPKIKLNGYLDYSNSDNIYKANPNLCYCISENYPTRIYPRKKFHMKATNDILSSLLQAYDEEVKWLSKQKNPLYLSITGGFNSKITMALTKNLQDKIKYFTYIKDTSNSSSKVKMIYDRDKKTVDKLRFNLNLNHHYISLDEVYITKKAINLLSTHTTSNYAYRLGLILKEKLKKDSIHIKSGLYDLGRISPDFEYDNTTDFQSLHKTTLPWKPKNKTAEETEVLYKSYINRNELKTIVEFDYPISLLIYWETRLGNWYSNITQETDLNHETFDFGNSRYVLDKLISLDPEEKVDDNLFKKIINQKWPVLNYFVPNSELTLDDVNTELIESEKSPLHQNGIQISSLKNIDLRIISDDYQISPLNHTSLKDDDHYLEIRNVSLKKIEFFLTSYYSRVKDHIYISINNYKKDIVELTEPHRVVIEPKENILIKYHYISNFNVPSWYAAGKLTISLILD